MLQYHVAEQVTSQTAARTLRLAAAHFYGINRALVFRIDIRQIHQPRDKDTTTLALAKEWRLI